MQRLVKEFYRTAKGPVMNNEDWWRLVFEDGRLHVEHEWDHVDVQGRTEPRSGKEEVNLREFLQGHGTAQNALRSALIEMFS